MKNKLLIAILATAGVLTLSTPVFAYTGADPIINKTDDGKYVAIQGQTLTDVVESADPTMIKVNKKGVGKAKKEGTVHVKTQDGSEHDVNIVQAKLSDKKIETTVGTSTTVSLQINGLDADAYYGLPVDWYSTNTNVAEVYRGTIQTTGIGKCKIYALCGGKKFQLSLKVTEAETDNVTGVLYNNVGSSYVKVKGVAASKSTSSSTTDENGKKSKSVGHWDFAQANHLGYELKDGSKLKSSKENNSTILRDFDNNSFLVVRTAKQKGDKNQTVSVGIGEVKQLYMPSDALGDTPTSWKSSNPKVASVGALGTLRGNAAGHAIITAKLGKATLKWKVTVTGDISTVSPNATASAEIAGFCVLTGNQETKQYFTGDKSNSDNKNPDLKTAVVYVNSTGAVVETKSEYDQRYTPEVPETPISKESKTILIHAPKWDIGDDTQGGNFLATVLNQGNPDERSVSFSPTSNIFAYEGYDYVLNTRTPMTLANGDTGTEITFHVNHIGTDAAIDIDSDYNVTFKDLNVTIKNVGYRSCKKIPVYIDGDVKPAYSNSDVSDMPEGVSGCIEYDKPCTMHTEKPVTWHIPSFENKISSDPVTVTGDTLHIITQDLFECNSVFAGVYITRNGDDVYVTVGSSTGNHDWYMHVYTETVQSVNMKVNYVSEYGNVYVNKHLVKDGEVVTVNVGDRLMMGIGGPSELFYDGQLLANANGRHSVAMVLDVLALNSDFTIEAGGRRPDDPCDAAAYFIQDDCPYLTQLGNDETEDWYYKVINDHD